MNLKVHCLVELLDGSPVANSSPVSTFATQICGHTHTIHPQPRHVGTTGKGYIRTVLYFVMKIKRSINQLKEQSPLFGFQRTGIFFVFLNRN